MWTRRFRVAFAGAAALVVGTAEGMSLYTSLESLVATPYAKLEQYVASKQIPSVGAGPRKRLGAASGGGETFDHGEWDALLRAHVTPEGRVDYDGLRGDEARFSAYLASLAAADVAALSDREALAFHLNAYNALCVARVLPHEGLKSILDLSTKESPVWDQPAGTLGGVEVSLNDVEHERLRLVWDEPELHACIVCASASCPSLAAFAFAADDLEATMRSRAAAWLNDATKGCALERRGAVARLSRILLWFEGDFATRGGVEAFVASHVADDATRAGLRRGAAKRYFAYDWSLNTV